MDCVRHLKREVGLSVSLISSSPKIGQMAMSLRDSGIDEIDFSLNSLDPKTHFAVTGVNDLPDLVEAIKQTVSTGIVVKINSVIMKGINDNSIFDLIRWCERNGISSLKLLDVIRDVHQKSNLSNESRLMKVRNTTLEALYVPLRPVSDLLTKYANQATTQFQGSLGHPMTCFMMPSGLKVIIKDQTKGAWYSNYCKTTCGYYRCGDALMALRLSPKAKLQFCLLRESKLSINDLNDNDTEKLLARVLRFYNSAQFENRVTKTEIAA